MNARVMLAGMFSLLAGIGIASGEEPPGNRAIVTNGDDVIVIEGTGDVVVGLPPIIYPGPRCPSYSFREWQALPYIYRYCSKRQQGYEAQRDKYYRGTGLDFRGSILVDCDSNDGWLPANGNMKTYYCP